MDVSNRKNKKFLGEFHCILLLHGKDIEIIKLLLNAAGDKTETLLTIKDDAGWTALHFAAKNGSTEMVKLLLDTAGNNTWTLLTTKSQMTVPHYIMLQIIILPK